jgi:hypothetical protein
MIRLRSKAGRVANPYLTRRLGVTGEQIMPGLLCEDPSWGPRERSSGLIRPSVPWPSWSACPYGEVHATVKPTALMVAAVPTEGGAWTRAVECEHNLWPPYMAEAGYIECWLKCLELIQEPAHNRQRLKFHVVRGCEYDDHGLLLRLPSRTTHPQEPLSHV